MDHWKNEYLNDDTRNEILLHRKIVLLFQQVITTLFVSYQGWMTGES